MQSITNAQEMRRDYEGNTQGIRRVDQITKGIRNEYEGGGSDYVGNTQGIRRGWIKITQGIRNEYEGWIKIRKMEMRKEIIKICA